VGAEGSIVVMPRRRWNEHTDRDPTEFGFYTGRILGVDAVWDYYGENTDYEMRTESWHFSDDERELVRWFRAEAEHHEVWT
jgi:hypothetical protein